jgi:cell division protein FtsB
MILALVLALFSFVTDDTFGRLSSMQRGVDQQKLQNDKLGDQVELLKREVSALQRDPRAIERVARTELGMSRPDEITVVFEKHKHQGSGAAVVAPGKSEDASILNDGVGKKE